VSGNNSVRISAGQWRSRLLRFPDAEGLRPTPDRVRQTVFNWLRQDLSGLTCLDLFAGTGVMGFESLSRGAQQVVMVESNRQVYQALNSNQQALSAQQARILHMDALQFLASSSDRFDVIFLDPPYHQQWLAKLLPLMHDHLKPDGLLYVEAEHSVQDPEGWQVIKKGRAGHVMYHLLKAL
jgi:16S rRNA (guanine(966)-N(2))-methyltransferase RsmD